MHLLRKLEQCQDDPFWDQHPATLLWMLHIAGSFSPKTDTRSGYKALLQTNTTSRFQGMYGSLQGLIEILKQFIWSEKMYRAQVEEFWKELHLTTSVARG